MSGQLEQNPKLTPASGKIVTLSYDEKKSPQVAGNMAAARAEAVKLRSIIVIILELARIWELGANWMLGASWSRYRLSLANTHLIHRNINTNTNTNTKSSTNTDTNTNTWSVRRKPLRRSRFVTLCCCHCRYLALLVFSSRKKPVGVYGDEQTGSNHLRFAHRLCN